jgi:hypothetical protein
MDNINEHLKLVSQWLDENVVSYPEPKSISLLEFDFNWERMTGNFYLELDGNRVADAFQLTLSQNGFMQFHPPMFFSPLGAPASFSAVNLTSSTELAISNALREIFPRLMPLGFDKNSGKCIWNSTPIEERIIDRNFFEEAKLQISSSSYSFQYQL